MLQLESKIISSNIPKIKCEGDKNIGNSMESPENFDNLSYVEKGNDAAFDIVHWHVEDVVEWATKVVHFTPAVIKCLQLEAIDGQVLLTLTEEDIRDFRYRLNYNLRFGELKKLWQSIHQLQQNRLHQRLNSHSAHHLPINQLHHSKVVSNKNNSLKIGSSEGSPLHHNRHRTPISFPVAATTVAFSCGCGNRSCGTILDNTYNDCESCGFEMSSVSEGCSANIPPEFFKTSVSLGESQTIFYAN